MLIQAKQYLIRMCGVGGRTLRSSWISEQQANSDDNSSKEMTQKLA